MLSIPYRVFAIGGASYHAGEAPALHRHLLRLAGKPRPRVCFLPTASGDSPEYIASFRAFFEAEGAEVSVYTITRPSEGVRREALLEQDILYVGGGNTARMLHLWRGRGVDRVILEAGRQGAILSGTSAGMNCWFEGCVTDSFGPLRELADGLGIVRGSACPHVDTEPDRLPTFRRLVAAGFPGGYALHDRTALWFDRLAEPGILAEESDERPRAWKVRMEAEMVMEEVLEIRAIGVN